MYQITLGTDKRYCEWISVLASRIKDKISTSILVVEESERRVYLGVALKNKENADKIIFNILYDFFLKDVKAEYLYSTIKRYDANEFLVQVYIKILKLFNTVDEKMTLSEKLKMYSNFSLDGFYKFKLAPLRGKWDELLNLTYNNLDLLKDEDSFSLLIENLISCLPLVYDRVRIDCEKSAFVLQFDDLDKKFFESEDAVVFEIVENLPKKIQISKNSSNKHLYCKLKRLFGVSFVQII
jgi:hypothetical protein